MVADEYKAAAFAFQSLARLPKGFNSDISLLHNNSFLIQEEEVARSGVLLFAFPVKSFSKVRKNTEKRAGAYTQHTTLYFASRKGSGVFQQEM